MCQDVVAWDEDENSSEGKRDGRSYHSYLDDTNHCLNPHPSERRHLLRLGVETIFLLGIAAPFVYLAVEDPDSKSRSLLLPALAVSKRNCSNCVDDASSNCVDDTNCVPNTLAPLLFVPIFAALCLLFLADLLVFEILCPPLGSRRYDVEATVEPAMHEELTNLELPVLEERARDTLSDNTHLGQPPQLAEGGDEQAFRSKLVEFIENGQFLKAIPDHNFITQSAAHKRKVHRNNHMPIPGACAAAAGLKVGDSVIVRGPDL